MPAKYVKAFLKGNKNDYRDAEAIAEAVQRPTRRLAPAECRGMTGDDAACDTAPRIEIACDKQLQKICSLSMIEKSAPVIPHRQ
jgi:hypothetical protein